MPIDDKLQQIAGSLEQQGKNPTEILDLIKSSKSYSDIGTKIDSLRSSGMKDNQIYGFLKTAKRSSVTDVPGSGRGYGEKIRSALHPAQTPEEQAALMKQGREETEAAQGAIRQGVINFFPNLGKTVWNLAKNLVYTPVAESVEQKSLKPLVNTAGSVAVGAVALPVGAAEKLIDKFGGETGSKFVDWLGRGALENFWQPFENQLKQKYGSPAKFREAIATRPAEVMMDVSMVLGLAGGAAKLAGRGEKAAAARESFAGKPYTKETFETMAKPEPAPSIAYRDLKRLSANVPPESTGLLTAGDALSEASRITNPLNIAQQTVGLLTRPLGAVLKKGEATRALAESKGIPTTVGEDIGSPFLQRTETLAERVPLVGMSGFREKQLAAADAAAKDFLAKYIIDPANPNIETNRAFTSKLYEDMKSSIKDVDTLPIYATKTADRARELLDSYPDVFKKFQNVKREAIINDIVKDAGKGAMQPKEFKDMWTLRDGLGEMIGQAKKKLQAGEVDKTTLSQLNSLYKAVNDDIDSWAQSVGKPELRTAINTANDAYKRYVVKYDLIQRAYDKAVGKSSARQFFSPQTFSTELKKMVYKDKQYKTFAPNEIDEISGLANIMQVVKRAGQFMENPPTGNRPIDIASIGLGIGAIFSPAIATKAAEVAGITAAFKFLTSNPKGKSILRAAGKMEPLDPRMGDILNYVYQVSQAVNNQQPRSQTLTGKEQEKKNLFQPSQLSPEGTQISNLLDRFESAKPEDRQGMRLDISKQIRNLRGIPKEERQNLIDRWNVLKGKYKETHEEILNSLDTLQ